MDSETRLFIDKEIAPLLEEAFVRHHGIFTDKGTSIFETLSEISHIEASVVPPGLDETIAGHVFHLTFYIKVLRAYLQGDRSKIDWSESWVVKAVTESAWKAEIEELRKEYESLQEFLRQNPEWDKNDNLGGLLAIVIHSVYHLGAIRQMKEVVRALA